MTDNSIRVHPADSPERFLATDHTVWFGEALAAPAEEQLLGLPRDRRFAAEVDGSDPGSYAGVYGVYPMTLAVPGGAADARQVPCAGLTWVGVHPDHRRRGVLSTMMRHHLEQVHTEDGTSVSALHASEPAIYGRYGYGLASVGLEVTLSRGTSLTAPHLEEAAARTSTRMGSVSDRGVPGRMRACHLATAEVGAVVGAPDYYERICQQHPEQLREKEPWRVLFAQRDGADVGFAMFRRTHKWERARSAGEVSVWSLVGDPAARLALLRRLVDLDLMASVSLPPVGADDPLLHWAGGPRATSDVATYDRLWVRLVDLPEALSDRQWSAACDLVVAVEDRTAPWNEGSWRFQVDADGQATVERTSSPPDLHLPIEALGSAYLGGGNLVAMHRAGLVSETRPGAVAQLWRAARTDLAPGSAWMF